MTTTPDKYALDHIASILRAPEWQRADYLEAIALIVTGTGRTIDHQEPCTGCGLGGWHGRECSVEVDEDGPIRARVKYEDAEGEELAPHDAFTSLDEAMRHYRTVIDNPWSPELGAVCVTSLTDDDVDVIATHRFAMTRRRRTMPLERDPSAHADGEAIDGEPTASLE